VTADANDPLRDLDRDIAPPDLLKHRVIGTLRERGVLRKTRRPLWRPLGAIAAALVLFAAGVGVGRRSPALVADRTPSYALLLYEGRDFDQHTPVPTYVAEYSAWAGSLRERGVLVSGRALDPSSRLMRDSLGVVTMEGRDVTTDEGTMAGFFIVHASSEAEAEAIARTCPHLKHGGRIALRRIVPT
jgi:hypothetical protein